jgi:hypothetical protein
MPATLDRVQRNTPRSVNEQIRRQVHDRAARYAARGPQAIAQRLAELENEWDVERYLETMAPTFTLLGLLLGLRFDKRFMLIPFVVQGFFLQHALQGWCPPLPVLRRMGVRTQSEIDEEKYALKALRGDIRSVHEQGAVQGAIAAAAG